VHCKAQAFSLGIENATPPLLKGVSSSIINVIPSFAPIAFVASTMLKECHCTLWCLKNEGEAKGSYMAWKKVPPRNSRFLKLIKGRLEKLFC
jgi:hypothetical protein